MKKLLKIMPFCLALLLSVVFIKPTQALAVTSNVGRLTSSKTYFIRNVQTGNYLQTQATVSDQAQPYMGSFPGRTSTRIRWKIIETSAGSGTYYIVPASNTNLSLNAQSENSINLRSISAGYSSSKWKIVLQSDGTYYIYSCSPSFAADSKQLVNTATLFCLFNSVSDFYGRWVFEEYLGTTRDNGATVTSYDYTSAGNGYASGHYANDVVSVGIFTLPLYSPYNGTVTYWKSTAIVNGEEYSTRIGNFVTVESSDAATEGETVLYAHLSAFRPAGWVASTAEGYRGDLSQNAYNVTKVGSRTTFRGEEIGLIGKSGSATGYHVHIEYFTDYDTVWGNTNLKNTWVYADDYNDVVRQPHSYLKFRG